MSLPSFGVGFESDTPLWYYVLKEAELSGGARLTGVGARIVGEVFLGLLSSMETPTCGETAAGGRRLPSRAPGTFGMVDLFDVRWCGSREPSSVAGMQLRPMTSDAEERRAGRLGMNSRR